MSIRESSSFTSRETSLKGWETRIASATPDMATKRSGSRAPLLPVIPIAVRCAPGMSCGVRPMARIFPFTASTSEGVAFGFITISMAGS